jgi:hypothetical protein
MSYKVVTQSKVIQAVARLHNFIVDNDKPPLDAIRLNPDGTVDARELERFGVDLLPDGEAFGEGAQGTLGFFGYAVIEYDDDGGTSARRKRCRRT